MSNINFGYILHDFVTKSSVKIDEIAKIKNISRPTAYTRYFNNEKISLLDIKEILDIIGVPLSDYFRKVEQELGLYVIPDESDIKLLESETAYVVGNNKEHWIKELLESQKNMVDIFSKSFKASEESLKIEKEILEEFRKASAKSNP